DTHFVKQVRQDSHVIFSETLPAATDAPVLRLEAAADLSYALSQNPAGKLPGRPSASATGTGRSPQHAWIVGYTPQLAMAVWVGIQRDDMLSPDKPPQTAGLPADIYRTVMTAAHEVLQLPPA